MAIRGAAPASELGERAQPQVHDSAQLHPFSQVSGQVAIGAAVVVAPGAAVRAEAGSLLAIGAESQVQQGAVVHGLGQYQVLGDDGRDYAIWIGSQTTLSHMVLIHGPAYIGDRCFIGFRSTVFNARLNAGCIVMMHALIQNVEIPANRLVPSGAMITTQEQADRLPEVQPGDAQFAAYIAGMSQAAPTADQVTATPIRAQLERALNRTPDPTLPSRSDPNLSSSSPSHPTFTQMQHTRLAPAVVEQARQLLSQGLHIGIEHADKRRFQTSTWTSCSPLQSTRDSEVLSALERCLAEHQGEYVRMFGIDARSKRRVSDVIIQRPDGSAPAMPKAHASSQSSYSNQSSYSSPSSQSYGNQGGHGSASSSKLSPQAIDLVRNILRQGFKIGTEHANARRFQTSTWTSCSPIQTNREAEAIAALEACLAEHQGEYVRVFGIDPRAKRRVSELVVQRPGDKSAPSAPTAGQSSQSSTGFSSSYSSPISNPPNYNTVANGYGSGQNSYGQNNYGQTSPSNGHSQPHTKLEPATVDQVRQLLAQGYRITAEHADSRRFQTSSWKSCSPIAGNRDGDVLSALEGCLAENPGEYVRFVGVDTKSKRRVAEVIIQRP